MSTTYRSPVVITVTSRLHVTKAALPASAKKFLREKLADRDSQLAELRTDRDAWKEQAERATRLLAPPVAQEPSKGWNWKFWKAND